MKLISTVWQATHLYFISVTGKKGSLRAAAAYVHQRSAIMLIEALIRAVLHSIVYREYVGPIFQSQLLSVGPNKSNNVGCSNIQDDSSNRIKRNSVRNAADLAPLFI